MKFISVITAIIFFLLTGKPSTAQNTALWNGKKCAVVLTYDDALNVHLDNVIPALDSAGFKGTFYLIGESPVVSKRMLEWRSAAKNGHELGNHSLRHPCDGHLQGRSWVPAETDLSKYSADRAVKEIRICNTLLQAIDGKTERTFAFPCGDTKIDTVSFYTALQNDFAGARGVQEGRQPINKIDLNNINCFAINGQSGEYLIGLVKKAIVTNTLLVFLFHGVGGEHSLNVSLEAHRQLIQYLKQQEKDIWIAPMLDVARYIKKTQTLNIVK